MTNNPFELPIGVNPNVEDINKVLVVVAHPDDIDFGCAGTVSWLTSQGKEVSYCLVTSGDAGGDADSRPGDARKETRETEQTNAAHKVGVQTLHFLRQADGQVEANLALREKITRIIRKEKPDLIITQSPKRRYDRIFASHPDHLAAGEATICATYPDCQNPHAYSHLLDEGLEPHQVKAMWLVAEEDNDTFVDITDHLELKFEALFSHESQISDQDAVREMMEEWAANNAKLAGLPDGRFVECFKFIQISF